MLPTLYAAAGGDISQINTDGYDVRPYLSGEQTDDPNKVWFWRSIEAFAVRKGEWKLEVAFKDQPVFVHASDKTLARTTICRVFTL